MESKHLRRRKHVQGLTFGQFRTTRFVFWTLQTTRFEFWTLQTHKVCILDSSDPQGLNCPKCKPCGVELSKMQTLWF